MKSDSYMARPSARLMKHQEIFLCSGIIAVQVDDILVRTLYSKLGLC